MPPYLDVSRLNREAERRTATIRRAAQARIPTPDGELTCFGFEAGDGQEHLAFVAGDVAGGQDVLTRVHSECLTGDLLSSLRCDCGDQLRGALRMIGEAGAGVVVYLRGQEGRGIGIVNKLRAYRLQDEGLDTVDANLALGLPVDCRDFSVAAAILRELGVGGIRLLTNNGAKVDALVRCGIPVRERVPMPPSVTEHNRRYLTAKRIRMGHAIGELREGA